MKVLMVNKFFHPVGGPESVIQQTTDALINEGHEVVPFAMQHPDNWPSEWSDYFVSNVDYKKGSYGPFRLASEAMRIIYSTEARRKIEALIAKTNPDLAHLHNIYHQMSPSILPALKKAGVATVLTLHDGKLMCPAEHFLVDGAICERCQGARFYNTFTHKCIKGSRLKSLVCTVEMYVHSLTKIYERNVDVFIAPSEFYRSKLLEVGRVDPERVVTIHNSVEVESIRMTEPGDYALYLGRIDRHKGVITLLKAMEQCPDVQLKMVGTGDAEDECADLIKELNLRNVTMEGFKTGQELVNLIKGSAFLITPSEWYENCPMVVLEAAAYGKPAIVTNMGGLPELVDDGENGFVVKPHSVDELADKIVSLGRDHDLVKRMGLMARKKAESEYTHKVHYSRLIKAYAQAITLACR